MKKKIRLLIAVMAVFLLGSMAVHAAECSHSETWTDCTGFGGDGSKEWAEISTYCSNCDDRVDVETVYFNSTYITYDGYGANISYQYWDYEDKKWCTVENKREVFAHVISADTSIGNPDFSTKYGISYDTIKIKSNPTRDDATFEGWAKFKLVEDEEGIYQKVFVPRTSSSPYYTLKQMNNSKCPDGESFFAAKWSDIPIEAYYKEVYVDIYDDMGAEISYSLGYYDEYGDLQWEDYVDSGFGLMVQVGKSLNTCQEQYKITKDPTREDAKFQGWARFKEEDGEYIFEPKSEDDLYYTTKE